MLRDNKYIACLVMRFSILYLLSVSVSENLFFKEVRKLRVLSVRIYFLVVPNILDLIVPMYLHRKLLIILFL